ncbi:MAG: hypothetical protein N2Z74_00490 [Syntrophales bacterium]|nr:hypothetical protein [Syntrophales bacterium]
MFRYRQSIHSQSQLRHAAGHLRGAVAAHNAEAKRLTLQEFRKRQEEYWFPILEAISVALAVSRSRFVRGGEFHDPVSEAIETAQPDSGFSSFVEPLPQAPLQTIDPLEDFTTYTEQDPNNRLTVSTYAVTASNLTIGESAWLVKDYGNAAFGEQFQHKFRFRFNNVGVVPVYADVWAVSNVIADGYTWFNNRQQALNAFLYRDSTATRIYLRDSEDGLNDQGYVNIALATDYYASVVRNGTACTLYVYSDANRTQLVGVTSVTLAQGRVYRYVFAAHSHNAGITERTISFTVGDFDLGFPEPSSSAPSSSVSASSSFVSVSASSVSASTSFASAPSSSVSASISFASESASQSSESQSIVITGPIEMKVLRRIKQLLIEEINLDLTSRNCVITIGVWVPPKIPRGGKFFVTISPNRSDYPIDEQDYRQLAERFVVTVTPYTRVELDPADVAEKILGDVSRGLYVAKDEILRCLAGRMIFDEGGLPMLREALRARFCSEPRYDEEARVAWIEIDFDAVFDRW